MRSSIAAVTAGITSSVLRDSVSGMRLTVSGLVQGELQPKTSYLYNSVKSTAINQGVCKHVFSEPNCNSLFGVLQYPLRTATKMVLSDILDECVDMALAEPAPACPRNIRTKAPLQEDSWGTTVKSALKAKETKKPSITTSEYWKGFMREVLVNSATDLVYDIGRKQAVFANSGAPPSVLDTATWAFASAAAGEFIRAQLDNRYTPDYIKAGMRSAVFKTSFSYFYALIMASSSS